jgi:anti-repressor protein
MNNLINITTNEQGSQVVSARELYEFLGVNAKFADWIKRMLDYGFTENEDYTTFLKKENRQTLKEYAITLDTAKGGEAKSN